jgi:hypothetical protein
VDGVRVVDPYGRAWWVGRRWLPWKPRRRARVPIVNEAAAEAMEAAEHPVILVIVLLALFPIVPILLLLLAEWLAVLALIPLLVLARLALPIPWTIVARRRDPDGTRVRYAAARRGLFVSRALIDRAAHEIVRSGAPGSLGRPNVRPPRADRTVVS